MVQERLPSQSTGVTEILVLTLRRWLSRSRSRLRGKRDIVGPRCLFVRVLICVRTARADATHAVRGYFALEVSDFEHPLLSGNRFEDSVVAEYENDIACSDQNKF